MIMMKTSSQLGHIGELKIIETLLARLPLQNSLIVPPGDDSAVARLDGSEADLVLTSDPVIEGTHFESGTNPSLIGNKAAGRVLSDLAAMGAVPKWILLNIAGPPSTPAEDITSISDAAASLCSTFGAVVAGGDIAVSQSLSVNAFACGFVPKDTAITRKGALPGDLVFVTDSLGGSISGKHLSFIPRVREGIWLRENGFPSAMTDITDGLATDLRHILQSSSAGAVLNLESIPVSDSLASMPFEKMIEHALSDGEDFELLFTVPPSRSKELIERWPKEFETKLSQIGYINDDLGRILHKSASGKYHEIALKGYEHFENQHI